MSKWDPLNSKTESITYFRLNFKLKNSSANFHAWDTRKPSLDILAPYRLQSNTLYADKTEKFINFRTL